MTSKINKDTVCFHLETGGTKVRAITFTIDGYTGAARVENIFEVDGGLDQAHHLLGLVRGSHGIIPLKVDADVPGALPVGSGHFILHVKIGMLLKTAKRLAVDCDAPIDCAPVFVKEKPKSVYAVSETDYATINVYDNLTAAKRFFDRLSDAHSGDATFEYIEKLLLWEVTLKGTHQRLGQITTFQLKSI